MMMSTSVETTIFLDDLDVRDTLVDLHRWDPDSHDAATVPVCTRCFEQRELSHRYCRLCGAEHGPPL